jgi:hypothetical protein
MYGNIIFIYIYLIKLYYSSELIIYLLKPIGQFLSYNLLV